MKKFKKSELCHRCMINNAFEHSRCTYCHLCLCTQCYYHFIEFSQKYRIIAKFFPLGGDSIEVTCYNCRESQRVMNKIDCWLAVHGSDKK